MSGTGKANVFIEICLDQTMSRDYYIRETHFETLWSVTMLSFVQG
jgi:hypothetical protein